MISGVRSAGGLSILTVIRPSSSMRKTSCNVFSEAIVSRLSLVMLPLSCWNAAILEAYTWSTWGSRFKTDRYDRLRHAATLRVKRRRENKNPAFLSYTIRSAPAGGVITTCASEDGQTESHMPGGNKPYGRENKRSDLKKFLL